MSSPRVLQAQIRDLMDAIGQDARYSRVTEALEGALQQIQGVDAPGMSPGERAARQEGQEPAYEPLRPAPAREEHADQPKSFQGAREAAAARMEQGATNE